ncbi:MAG TPA: cytochrome c maturation protein CcmE [Terriglobales bacterium]|nr:cytochrome c maturation protein CcmE [Terriglobales bacterium]
MPTRTKFAIGASLLVLAVAYLIYSGVQQSSMYYFTIEEFIATKEKLDDEGIRVAGRVAPGTVVKKMTHDGAELKFRIGDFKTGDDIGTTVPVQYVGVTPDMFKDEGGSDVIIEGKYRDGTLHAQKVLTQCPSKYEAEAESLPSS